MVNKDEYNCIKKFPSWRKYVVFEYMAYILRLGLYTQIIFRSKII